MRHENSAMNKAGQPGRAALDVQANRQAIKYARGELLRRFLWSACMPLFRYSPRTFFGWRRFLLGIFGAQIGKEVHIYSNAIIYMPWNLEIGDWSAIGEWALVYNLGKVRIGDRVTVSHKAHICAGTHQYMDRSLPLIKAGVDIESQAWVCSEAFVGPGVTIGEGAVIGARAVAVKDVPPWVVVAGNPAKYIKDRVMVDEHG